MKRPKFEKECDEKEDEKEDGFQVLGNKIYFYCDVTTKNILKLNTELTKIRDTLIVQTTEFTDHSSLPKIYLYIHSIGGDLYAGISAMDHISRLDIPVITIIDGLACSAATLISISGKERYITENSHVLIHQIRTGMWGRFDEVRDEMQQSEKLQKRMRFIYGKYTNIPKSVMDKLMTNEIYFNAEESQKYHIVDKIV